MSTTAHYRTVAHNFEATCNWSHAAEAWEKAILLYPRKRGKNGKPAPTQGQLAMRDITLMSARLDGCLAMADKTKG